MMQASKGILTLYDTDCIAFHAPAILKNIQNPHESCYFFMFLASQNHTNSRLRELDDLLTLISCILE